MKAIPMADQSPIVTKTVELCQTILDQPAYQNLKKDILAFLEDQDARRVYEKLCDMQEELHGKQHAGQQVTEEEFEAFQSVEKEFLAMPVATKFIEAQRQMQKIEETVSTYVRRTFELGRVPDEDDMPSSGGCGSGCGCHG